MHLRQRRAEEAKRAHLGDDLAVEALVAIGRDHARKKLLLRIGARGVAHHALLVGQLAFEVEGVLPVERGLRQRGGLLLALGARLLGDPRHRLSLHGCGKLAVRL